MSKIFKNISLVERLANSPYANINTNTQAQPQQGSTTVDKFNFAPTQGSTTINKFNFSPSQGSTTPKPFIIFPSQGSTTPIRFLFTPNRTSPTINTNFPKQVSLKDRVEQSSLGTTKHLPQFFLSDVFTDYIKITPFGIFNHTSNIVVVPFGIFTHTSDVVVNPFSIFTHTSNTTVNVFGIFNHTSNIVLTTPIQDVSGLQGVIVPPNGVTPTNSFIVLTTPTQLIQSPSPQIDLFIFTPNQGSIILNAFDFTPTQGSTTVGLFDFSPSQGSTTVDLFDFTPEQGGVQYKNFIVKVKQFDPNVKFELFDFVPEYETIQIKTLRYTADRLLATATPKIKHGSTDLPYNLFQPDKGKENEDPGILFTEINKNEQVAQRNILIKGDQSNTEDYKRITSYLSTKYKAIVEGKHRTADLNRIVDIRDSINNGDRKDFREFIGTDVDNVFVKYIDDIPPSEYISEFKDVDARKKNNDENNPDLIDFKITSARTGTVVQFTAYLTQFGHTFSPTWNDINYVGRQDTLKAFKGVTQGVSLAFTTVAFAKEDMPIMYEKLRDLAIITSIGKPVADNTYLLGPACKLTIGKWFVDTPCAFNSLKYDIETSDYPWDIDRNIQMPHYIKVSLDCTILGDNNGNPLGKPGIQDKIFNYV
jgi:hypothetical protein